MQIRFCKILAIIACIVLQVAVIGQVKANDVLTRLASINNPAEFKAEISMHELTDNDYYSLTLQVCGAGKNTKIYEVLIDEIAKNTKFKLDDYHILAYELLIEKHQVCVIHLLDSITDLNMINPLGKVILSEAILHNNDRLAKEIIERKVDFDIIDWKNNKPINYAVGTDNLEIYKLLLQKTNLIENGVKSNISYYYSLRHQINNSELSDQAAYLMLLDKAYEEQQKINP